jgi:hypothetical protein
MPTGSATYFTQLTMHSLVYQTQCSRVNCIFSCPSANFSVGKRVGARSFSLFQDSVIGFANGGSGEVAFILLCVIVITNVMYFKDDVYMGKYVWICICIIGWWYNVKAIFLRLLWWMIIFELMLYQLSWWDLPNSIGLEGLFKPSGWGKSPSG